MLLLQNKMVNGCMHKVYVVFHVFFSKTGLIEMNSIRKRYSKCEMVWLVGFGGEGGGCPFCLHIALESEDAFLNYMSSKAIHRQYQGIFKDMAYTVDTEGGS